MIELTPTAKERLDAYVSRLRSALRGTPHVEADEVEQNVREHVEIALASVPTPITSDHLGAVLDRLGPPERWVGEEEQTGWKRAFERLRSGPEDWRLAYISFGLFLAMFVFMPIGGFFLLIPAYIVSRAVVAFVEEKNERLGARQWLVAPAIAVPVLLILGLALFAVPAGGITWALEERGIYRESGISRGDLSLAERVTLETSVVMVAFGVWWLVVAPILAAARRPLQIAFKPVLDHWTSRHLAILAIVGATIGALGAALMYSSWSDTLLR
jgi:hypothetical protein